MFVECEVDSKTHPEKILYKNNQENFKRKIRKRFILSDIKTC